MYFKIEKSGCSECRGLVQIRYDLFLEPNDYNYDDHHVQVPVLPFGGYPGEKNSDGSPVNNDDYDKWENNLEKIWRDNPFCCHFIYAEPEITDEEILYVGELALSMQYENWSVHKNLHRSINQPVLFSLDNEKKEKTKSRINDIVVTDFTKIKIKSLIPYRIK